MMGRIRRAALAAVAVPLVAAGMVTTASTASAGCVRQNNFGPILVQVDNCPGTGYTWAFVSVKKQGRTTKGIVTFKFSGRDRTDTWEVKAGESRAFDYKDPRDPKIVEVTACDYFLIGWAPPIEAHVCSKPSRVPA